MKVLVDTSVWSLAFRRKRIKPDEQLTVQQLQALILEGDACMTGAIRQEVLSGIKHQKQYEKLKIRLQAFDDLAAAQRDHEIAADMFNQCRRKGVQGSHIDFLICAIATNARMPIFAVDGDFPHYAEIIPIELYQPTGGLLGIHETRAEYVAK